GVDDDRVEAAWIPLEDLASIRDNPLAAELEPVPGEAHDVGVDVDSGHVDAVEREGTDVKSPAEADQQGRPRRRPEPGDQLGVVSSAEEVSLRDAPGRQDGLEDSVRGERQGSTMLEDLEAAE